MVTLFSYARTFPQFANHVYMDTAPGTTQPAPPFALVWEKPGGVETPYYGGSDTLRVYPCLTVFTRPTGTENAATARLKLAQLMQDISAGVLAVDTHFDGVTAYVPGSLRRLGLPAPTPDPNNPGGYYATLLLSALIHQQ